MFPVLCDYIVNTPLIDKELIFSDIQQHLKLLSKHFRTIATFFTMVQILLFEISEGPAIHLKHTVVITITSNNCKNETHNSFITLKSYKSKIQSIKSNVFF